MSADEFAEIEKRAEVARSDHNSLGTTWTWAERDRVTLISALKAAWARFPEARP